MRPRSPDEAQRNPGYGPTDSIFKQQSRHCEPTGRREAPPDDRLREAIQLAAQRKKKLDCFVARAPLRKRFAFVAGNDDEKRVYPRDAKRPRFAINFPPSPIRGRRECRAPEHPQPRV
jgi:hypothetical protein